MPVDDILKGSAIGSQLGDAAVAGIKNFKAARADKAQQEEFKRIVESGQLELGAKPDRLREGFAEQRAIQADRSQRKEFGNLVGKVTKGEEGIRQLMVDHGASMSPEEQTELSQMQTLRQRYAYVAPELRPVPGQFNDDGSAVQEVVVPTPEGIDISMERYGLLSSKRMQSLVEENKLRMDLYNQALARYPTNRYLQQHIAARVGQGKDMIEQEFKALEARSRLEEKYFSEHLQGEREARNVGLNLDADLVRKGAQGEIDTKLEREKSKLRREEEAQKAELLAPSKARERAADLRKEFQSRPETKEFSAARTGFEQIQNLAEDNTGTSDYALIVTSLKILDPGGSVKEGEVQSVNMASGELSRFQSYLNRYLKDGRLPDEARNDLVQVARSGYEARVRNQLDLEKNYADQATRDGSDIESIVLGGSLVPDEHLQALGLDRTAGSARTRPTVTAEMITVSNGTERFTIPASDLKEAEAEGFKVVR